MLMTKEILGKDIYELNRKHYDMLKKEVTDENVTWILGAGISAPAGLPNWTTLLAKMWARLSELENEMPLNHEVEEGERIFQSAKHRALQETKGYPAYHSIAEKALQGKFKDFWKGVNMLESAEYMWNYIEMLIPEGGNQREKRRLQERVLKALLRDSLQTVMEETELKNKLKNQAVGCLAKLLKKQKKGSVITYNYDDLLEFCLDKVANASSHEVQVICDCDERKTDNSQRINIHHPHGALSIKRNRFSKESEHIILTEHSYYQMEQKAYSWQNSVQAKALMDTSCAFIGFSGDDYNFRRIIKNVDCACKPRHYIFFCLNDLFHELYQEEVDKRYEEELLMSAAGGDSEVKKDEIRRELLEDKNFVYENIQLIDRLFAQYHYWSRHGIIPIWTTFDELPELIHGFYG